MRVFIEDALAEEDGDGDGDGRGEREEHVRAREAPRRRRAVVVVPRSRSPQVRFFLSREPALGGREKQFNPADISLVGALWSRPDACKHLLS